MTLAAPSPTQPARVDALSPLRLPGDLQLTPEQFWTVCSANPDAVLELDASGHLIHITPTGGETGARNQALGALLWLAVRTSGLELKVFDSSSGFRLPDGSVLSPDAALVRLERWQALSLAERRGFPPLCPDLVVELASYQANGAQLGWLLIPHQQAVEIWPAAGEGEPEHIQAAVSLDAGPLFPGLQIELQEIWSV
jgi:Uma2 family endonuclease